jgi:hypothetical protein
MLELMIQWNLKERTGVGEICCKNKKKLCLEKAKGKRDEKCTIALSYCL